MTLLPQIALVICFVVFVAVCVWALFFLKKREVDELAELPLQDDEKKL